MPRRKPKFAISVDRFLRSAPNQFSLVGVSLNPNGTGRIRVKLRATNFFWVHNTPPAVISDNEVRIDATPTAKNPRTRDGDDDLTVTVTVDEETGDEETGEVTYDDVVYDDPLVKKAKARTATKKKK